MHLCWILQGRSRLGTQRRLDVEVQHGTRIPASLGDVSLFLLGPSLVKWRSTHITDCQFFLRSATSNINPILEIPSQWHHAWCLIKYVTMVTNPSWHLKLGIVPAVTTVSICCSVHSMSHLCSKATTSNPISSLLFWIPWRGRRSCYPHCRDAMLSSMVLSRVGFKPMSTAQIRLWPTQYYLPDVLHILAFYSLIINMPWLF